MSWNLESHILDHAAITSNKLPDSFDLEDSKNVHFTFSIDKSQLIINHNCKDQKDIDKKMKAFFNDLLSYEYKFEESQGRNRPKRKMTLDFSNILFAYHNTDSDSINSKNYEVEPHFHLLIPAKLKNKYAKSTKVGRGYLNLRRMINDIATKHNLTFNFDENVDAEKDKILKQKATKFTWFTKRVNDTYFKSSIENGTINKYIEDFIKYYKKTENIQYYIKGMLDFKNRLERQNIDFYFDNKNLRKEHFPLFLNKEQLKTLDIINTGNEELIKTLIENRSNKLIRAYIEYNYGFNNPIIKELGNRGNTFKKIDLNLSNTNVDIEKKKSGEEKYKLSLAYHTLGDVKSVFNLCTNDRNFLELMKKLGYMNIKFKAKNVNKKRQRVGFTFEKDNEFYTIYFSSLNLTYQDFTAAYKKNKEKDSIDDLVEFNSYDPKINYYVPLKKKKSYQEKIFYKIYNITPSINLENYYIKNIEQGNIELINKRKNIHVKDEKEEIKSNPNSYDLKEEVSLMLEMARGKGWSYDNLEINGTDEFKKEVKKQIKERKEFSNVDIEKVTSYESLKILLETHEKNSQDNDLDTK